MSAIEPEANALQGQQRIVLSKAQWTAAGALAMAVLGLLLAWASAFIVSVNGISTGDGKLFGVLLVITAALLALRVAKPTTARGVILIVAWALLVVFAFAEINNVSSNHVNVGSGLLIDTAAALVGLVASVIDIRSKRAKTT
jgi:hypothetical protein